jgi:cytochrome c oxidase subunit 2
VRLCASRCDASVPGTAVECHPPLRRFFIQGLLVAALVVLVGVGFLAWIGSEGGLTPVPPASVNAADIQDVYVWIGAFASAVFLVVMVPLALFVVRFRGAGRERREEGPQITGHARLELAWVIGPILILVAIAAFTAFKVAGIEHAGAARAGDADLTVKVEGHQFYWRYVYENGAVAFDTLRLPVDRTVRWEMTAPEGDVIHSFWFPALGPKEDVMPGQTTELVIRPTRVGSYEGKCAELCGLQHGAMTMQAQVLPQDEFDQWLEGARRRDDLGQEIFTTVCSKCHFAAPEYAPNLAGNPLLGNAEALTSIIRNGRGQMPAVGQTWTDEEVRAIVEYARQFGGGGEG